jgi:hypothetical protein
MLFRGFGKHRAELVQATSRFFFGKECFDVNFREGNNRNYAFPKVLHGPTIESGDYSIAK